MEPYTLKTEETTKNGVEVGSMVLVETTGVSLNKIYKVYCKDIPPLPRCYSSVLL